MSQLRVALPPLAQLSLDSVVAFAWLDRQGQLTREGHSTLLQLALRGKTPAIAFFLHPQDSVLASIDLPLLPSAKTSAAVQCAAQSLILGDCAQMHVAHSPRDTQGRVHIAWLSRQGLAHFGQLLRLAHLNVRGLYPAAYALPSHDVPVACLYEGHLLVRYTLEHAVVHPAIDEALSDLLLEAGPGLQWVGAAADFPVSCLPAEQRWAGPLPGWGLHGGLQQRSRHQPGWGRAAACCAVALAVWTLGLNLYAARQAAQGQRLKTEMSQRVKQAFPELPVILNPLQQARQQLAARQTGATADATPTFASMVLQAANTLPSMAGSVQRLLYENGELQLSLLQDARRHSTDKTWQAALAQAGIAVSATDEGWVLRPASQVPAGDANAGTGADDE
ncbi:MULTISPECIES: type II secretion system protein GspL [unclassified Pseudomonas]|uniref:type II secretion system protein GspL n=1 Tax=unclassified Pseudomonas TaxID=196821 RepID=UPI002AC9D547|nr:MULTISPECIES: type II secretion system protein GspL [unclassified Pseudomonas]MEB0048388.1 type II secretion system protein GspL [Pseudomonas sp. Dout3]MEB0097556.1 type II secretion system protein GspL [Pseudomonas sp. DC1.2]WPX56746.1 type II secretion system protein GspL [Pseudomonas sp. DC1.2]